MSEKEKKITIYYANYNFYRKYHHNIGNILVHILCIPAIVWSIFGFANKTGQYIGLDQTSYYKFIPSTSIYLSYMLYYYIIAPRKIFWQTFYFYFMILINSNSYYNSSNSITKYLIVQILGWVFQIASHKYLEGNSPALLKGAVQSFITAPIFIVDELVQNLPGTNFALITMIYSLYKLLY